MIEEILNDEKIKKRQIWHVLQDIELLDGEEGFGKLSIFGMEEALEKYAKGIFDEKIHSFYEKYAHRFVGCEDEDKLRENRHKFNKEIETGVIRYLK